MSCAGRVGQGALLSKASISEASSVIAGEGIRRIDAMVGASEAGLIGRSR